MIVQAFSGIENDSSCVIDISDRNPMKKHYNALSEYQKIQSKLLESLIGLRKQLEMKHG